VTGTDSKPHLRPKDQKGGISASQQYTGGYQQYQCLGAGHAVERKDLHAQTDGETAPVAARTAGFTAKDPQPVQPTPEQIIPLDVEDM
jgi:hypothetical protein